MCGLRAGGTISAGLGLVLVLAVSSQAGIRPDTILSIVLQGDHIVVSTSLGLRETTGTAKGWSVMPLPPGTRPGGCLAGSNVETARLYYSPPVNSARHRDRCMAGLGLWTTADLGRTWTQVDRAHLFFSVFVHRSGVIYTAARSVEEVHDLEC
jgi:hypothetical protein